MFYISACAAKLIFFFFIPKVCVFDFSDSNNAILGDYFYLQLQKIKIL